jgi:pantothenate kinase type III
MLLIDSGNTRIKWAYADEKGLRNGGVLPIEQAGDLPQQLDRKSVV